MLPRKEFKFTYENTQYIVQALTPWDFKDLAYFPFSYYKISNEEVEINKIEVKRDWKIKPKQGIYEDKVNAVQNRILELGVKEPKIGKLRKISIESIKANEMLYNLLVYYIHCMTFNLTDEQIQFGIVNENISQEIMLRIYQMAKEFSIEPYKCINEQNNTQSEIFNAKRWDFNMQCLNIGRKMENKQIEEQMQSMKSKMRR